PDNLLSHSNLHARVVVRPNQRLDLSLPISQFSEFNFSPYPALRIRGRNLLQSHYPRLSRLDLTVLPRGVARILNYITAQG
ncbi:MAG: hypothetical protein WA741_29290, partial [Candidatus Sulfotelmatobacter sp.]